MDKQAKIAFIQAQTAMMLVELEEMKAENAYREHVGAALAYDGMFFAQLRERYKHLEHNELLEYLRD